LTALSDGLTANRDFGFRVHGGTRLGPIIGPDPLRASGWLELATPLRWREWPEFLAFVEHSMFWKWRWAICVRAELGGTAVGITDLLPHQMRRHRVSGWIPSASVTAGPKDGGRPERGKRSSRFADFPKNRLSHTSLPATATYRAVLMRQWNAAAQSLTADGDGEAKTIQTNGFSDSDLQPLGNESGRWR